MNNFFSANSTRAYFFDALTTKFVMAARYCTMGSFFLEANATPCLCRRRLASLGLFFYVLKQFMRGCAFCKNRQNGTIDITMPLCNMVSMTGSSLYAW